MLEILGVDSYSFVVSNIVRPSSHMSCILGSMIRKDISILRYIDEIWKISYSSPSYFIACFGFIYNADGAIYKASFVTPI